MGFCTFIVIRIVAIISILSSGLCYYVSHSVPQYKRFRRDAELVRPLCASSQHNNNNRAVSSSDKERREEEKRRRERAHEVVIGKTSAVSGATDYALNPAATQEQWMRQASRTEQEVALQTDLGMDMLRMLRLEEATEAFDRVFELKPDAYLWQAGIARYYLGDWDGAADIFARCAEIYETRFLEPASEERIWRNACLLKKLSSMSRTERKSIEQSNGVDALVSQVQETDSTAELIGTERRKVVKVAQELFQSTVSKDYVKSIISRAKLRSIAGTIDESRVMDRKLRKISSFYYLGLHSDALGESLESKRCMKMALKLCPNANSVDLMHALPTLHMKCRNLFDDERFDETKGAKTTNEFESRLFLHSAHDPALLESIRYSVDQLRLVDVKDILRSRGLRTGGSKEETQSRLFESLINDPDLLE